MSGAGSVYRPATVPDVFMFYTVELYMLIDASPPCGALYKAAERVGTNYV